MAVCNPSAVSNGTDLPGGDYKTAPHVPSTEACQAMCCEDGPCVAFVWAAHAPSAFKDCINGQPCCYLKSTQPNPKANPIVSSGTIDKPSAGHGATPPTGMRSAVPLGGLSTGNVELRADGSFRDWTVVNQSPAGAAKYAWLNSTMAGIVVEQASASGLSLPRASAGAADGGVGPLTDTKLPFATHVHDPASRDAIQPAAQISYRGAHPVARLDVDDPRVGAAGLQGASLFGYSSWQPGDVNASSRPAVVLSAGIQNDGPGSKDVVGRFFVSLSIPLEDDMARGSSSGGGSSYGSRSVRVGAGTPRDCLAQCQGSASCASWTMPSGGPCTLHPDVPENAFEQGSFSGVKGSWLAQDQDGICCLLHSRQAPGPTRGEIGLCFESQGQACDAGAIATGSTLGDLWSSTSAGAGMQGAVGEGDPVAAVAVPFAAPAGTNVTVDVVLAWSFPNYTWLGKPVGNAYAAMYPTAHAAAASMLGARAVTLSKIKGTHDAFLGASSLPLPIADMLVNSLSHTRSLQWFADRQWRQFEAMDCVNVDSVHNNQERHIPYTAFFSDVVKSNLRAWGAGQGGDGMVQEQLGCGCMRGVPEYDTPCGRVMSDVSSAYLLYVSEFLLWANDTALTEELYPYCKRAAEWHMSISNSTQWGYQPYKLQTTYDILGLNGYPISTYSTAFHLMAMDACVLLAEQVGGSDLAAACTAAKAKAQTGLDQMLWVGAAPDKGFDFGHYAAYYGNNKSVMADTFFGMTCGEDLGFSDLLADPSKAVEHLLTEQERNDGPHGLVIMTGRDPDPKQPSSRDGQVWQMGSPNWASLMMRLNQTLKETTGHPANVSVEEALAQPLKSMGRWRDLRDEWNVAGLLGGPYTPASGYPYITSHYGYFMSSWRTPLALSGQLVDLRAGKGSMQFHPQVDAPFSLPWYIPDAAGRVEGVVVPGGVQYTVRMTVAGGAYETYGLRLDTLGVHGSSPSGPVVLLEGKAVSWTSKA